GAVGGLAGHEPDAGEQTREQAPIVRIVVDDEHAPLRLIRRKRHDALLRARALVVGGRGQRDLEAERRALAELALHVELASEQTDVVATDREPEPGAFVDLADLAERLEQNRKLLGRNAAPGVLDRESRPTIAPRDAQRDRALRAELRRVAEQVDQHL